VANLYHAAAGLPPIDDTESPPAANTYYVSAGLVPDDLTAAEVKLPPGLLRNTLLDAF